MKQKLISSGRVYKHFKGGYYLVLFEATDAMTDKPTIVYQQLTTGRVFTRPLDVFGSKVDKEKYPTATQEWRFEEL